MTNVQLTRNQMAVGRVQLVGGRFDGRTMLAVIGAPVTVLVKEGKKKMENGTGWFTLKAYWTGGDIVDGEKWKSDQKKDCSPPVPPQRVAVYAPRIVDGKPTPLVDFVEELAFAKESQ